MLTLRRTDQRFDESRGKQEAWFTFSPVASDSGADGFGDLSSLDEIRVPPGGTVSAQSPAGAELITYVFEGLLAYKDSLGLTGSMLAGEFRRMSVAQGVRSHETNSSRTNWTRVFRLGLSSSRGLQSSSEQKRFSVAQRRDGLCLVASGSARAGSLRIHADGFLYSALLRPGQHLVHELSPGRRAWLHVVKGQIAFRDLLLTRGDAVGVSAERSLSFTGTGLTESEVLLVDVA